MQIDAYTCTEMYMPMYAPARSAPHAPWRGCPAPIRTRPRYHTTRTICICMYYPHIFGLDYYV